MVTPQEKKTSPSNPRLLAAMDYAARKWRVIPLAYPAGDKCSCGKPDCQSPAKHPLTQHGLKDASTNPAVIRGWWTKWPLANIGLITGAQSGLVVLDIDKKNGGLDNLKKLEQKGNLPLTPQVETGGGGRHYYLAHNGRVVRNRAKLAGLSGIDVRGDGGYVVAPPSLHMSGESYAWMIRPDGTKPAAIPDWLYRIFEEEVRKYTGIPATPGLSEWVQMWAGVESGQRNDVAARLAGRLIARGLPHEEVKYILDAWNAKNTPPLTSDELLRTIQSIASSESRKPAAIGVMDAEYFMTADIERPPIIVAGGLLFQGSNLMITGASGAGKSLLSIQLAICISKGLPFLGLEVPDPYQVLFIQSENPKFAIRDRLRAIGGGMNVRHLPKMHFAQRTFRPDINNPRDQREIIKLIEQLQAQVVILDPLSSYHAVNENDNIAMRRTLDNLTHISAQTNCSWIVIHHEGKPGDGKENAWRFRGASSIRDWADAMIGLIEKSDENRILRILSFDKIRMGKRRAALLLQRDDNFVHNLIDEDALVPMSLIADCLIEMGGSARSKTALVKVIRNYVECADRTIYRAVEIAENRIWFQSDKLLKLIGKI